MDGGAKVNRDGYLSRIGVDPRGVRPDIETLRLLQYKHLLHVPFENLDIHWKRQIVLDTNRFYEKIVINGRGGFCYELNGLFNELLIAIGFHTHLISGRVYGPNKVPGPELAPWHYDVTPDGQRFVLLESVEEIGAKPMTLVINWLAGARR